MTQSYDIKARGWIPHLLIAISVIFAVAGFVHIVSVAATPTTLPAQAENEINCALLDDPAVRGLMSGMLETKLLVQCGRTNELGQVLSDPVGLEALGLDVLVNDPSGDSGPSRTQSETSLARNETNGVLCSGYNDSYHYVGQGLGITGFSSSNDNGATWTDHGVIPGGGGSLSWGDPAVTWRKLDGHFYISTLHDYGLGFWDLGTDCTSATWVAMVHNGGSDDKELLTADNNPSSPYYGRLYVAWTDFSNGHIKVTYSDNKTTWSSPVDASQKSNVQGAWPVVDPVTNDVYVAWVHWDSYPSGPIDIEVTRSTNGGSSFTFVTNPANNVTNPRDAAASGSCGRPALKGNIRYLPSPQIVVDNGGVLHVVYSYDPDGYNTGDVINVYYRRSVDHGATWSAEIRLNDDTTTLDQFFPALTVTPSGTVGAFWYDRRLNGNNINFDYYETISYDNGLTFDENQRVSDVSSPVVLDPNLATCYHGDYDTSKSDDTRFYIQWADDRGGTPDVYMDTDIPVQQPITGLAAENDSPTFLGETTQFTATVETGTGITYEWAFGDGNYGAGQYPTHEYSDLGSYTAIVTATNSLGFATTTTNVSIVDAPITDLLATNDSPTELGSLTTLTATIGAGTNVSFAWDFGDDTTGSGEVITHTYPVVGEYTATVTATNSVSVVSTTTLVTITDVPITGLSAQNDGPTRVRDATVFTATIATGSGVTYNWEFGDGTFGIGQVTSHMYDEAGLYTATVTATNSVGDVFATTDVTVVNHRIYLPVTIK